MLLRFTVENDLSFRDRTDLSFVATARKEQPEYRLPTRHAAHGLLPVVGLWGPNASGKSNLLASLLNMRAAVQDSFARRLPDAPAPWSPWMMRTAAADPPSMFELEFTDSTDRRYIYGFTQDARGFATEWLTRWTANRSQRLFERDRDGAVPWYFNPVLGSQKRCKQIAEATRANCLYLSAAAQYNHSELLPAYEAITRQIVAEREIRLHGVPLFSPEDPLLGEDFRGLLASILAAADTGVIDVSVRERPKRPDPGFIDKLPTEIVEVFREDNDRKLMEVGLVHRTDTGEAWTAPPGAESSGTHILLVRMGDLLKVMRSGALLVADEFQAGLHPDLAAILLSLFCSAETNPNGAQLLFATHDRTALDLLRSDSIGLVDKDAQGRSSLAYASDYKHIRSRDNLRLAYEQGRIRGVPVLGDLADLFAQGVRHGAK